MLCLLAPWRVSGLRQPSSQAWSHDGDLVASGGTSLFINAQQEKERASPWFSWVKRKLYPIDSCQQGLLGKLGLGQSYPH